MIIPNPRQIDGFIREIAEKFSAPEEDVAIAVESCFNRALQYVTGYSIDTWVEKYPNRWELKIWACNGWDRAETVKELDLETLSKKAVRLAASQIMRQLRNYEVAEHYSVLSSLRERVLDGHIVKKAEKDGTLYVDLYYPIEIGGFYNTVTGMCEKRYQVKTEQSRYKLGAMMKWYVRHVDLVKIGGELKISPKLDRQTARLPELLLRKYCNRMQDCRRIIKCSWRRPGGRSVVWTSAPIPQRILRLVQEEIGDYLAIKFLNVDNRVRQKSVFAQVAR